MSYLIFLWLSTCSLNIDFLLVCALTTFSLLFTKLLSVCPVFTQSTFDNINIFSLSGSCLYIFTGRDNRVKCLVNTKNTGLWPTSICLAHSCAMNTHPCMEICIIHLLSHKATPHPIHQVLCPGCHVGGFLCILLSTILYSSSVLH